VKLSDAAVRKNRNESNELPAGLRSLLPDLTPAELASAPTLRSVDDLLIEDLTDDEYAAFVAGLEALQMVTDTIYTFGAGGVLGGGKRVGNPGAATWNSDVTSGMPRRR
jgi:hypothetical protein